MATYGAALDYAKTRKQWKDRPIAAHQLVQERLAWMITEITKGQLLAWRLGRMKDDKTMKPHHVSMAKRNNVWVARECAKLARDPRRQRRRQRVPGLPPSRQHRERLHVRGHARHPHPDHRRGRHGRARPPVNAAEAVGRTLAELGVRDAFGVLGSGNFITTQALHARRSGVFHHLPATRTARCRIADGLRAALGRVGVCSVPRAPGSPTRLTGLAEAAKARTPLLRSPARPRAAALNSNFRIDQAGVAERLGAGSDASSPARRRPPTPSARGTAPRRSGARSCSTCRSTCRPRTPPPASPSWGRRRTRPRRRPPRCRRWPTASPPRDGR